MTEQLKPCPFCGGINVIHSGYRMYCHACGAEGPDADSADESAAIAAWNRRDQPAQAGAEPVAVLRVYMERHDMGQSLEPNPAFQVEIARANMAAKNLPLGTYDLYTRPPARVPLTDDEIRAAYESVYIYRAVMGHGSFSFARAVIAAYEAAHGIGGGK